MKVLAITLALASVALASPIQADQSPALKERNASGCYHFASPTHCVPGVCMCANGWIYYINRDRENAGLDGCDPPWGFIATNSGGYPGAC